jgi:hypothetical protein
MSIVLPALAIAFAASCVWLAVRIVNRRERWAKWTAAGTLVGIPLLYVLSFGPACRLAAEQFVSPEALGDLYEPLALAPDWARDALMHCARACGGEYQACFLWGLTTAS